MTAITDFFRTKNGLSFFFGHQVMEWRYSSKLRLWTIRFIAIRKPKSVWMELGYSDEFLEAMKGKRREFKRFTERHIQRWIANHRKELGL